MFMGRPVPDPTLHKTSGPGLVALDFCRKCRPKRAIQWDDPKVAQKSQHIFHNFFEATPHTIPRCGCPLPTDPVEVRPIRLGGQPQQALVAARPFGTGGQAVLLSLHATPPHPSLPPHKPCRWHTPSDKGTFVFLGGYFCQNR